MVTDSVYSLNMQQPTPLRLRIIDPAAIVHVMENPARGYRYTTRELAEKLGCSIGTLSHMRTGSRLSVPAELAQRFAEAVGCETSVLFRPAMSTDSVSKAGAA